MLVTARPDQYRIVAQTEHANQVGRFAEHWGNETFDAPEPDTATTIAAYLHDNGWWEWDLYPHVGDGGPVNLLDVSKQQWSAFYTRGIDNAAEVDPYAGLLVSMHGAGVRRQRYGTQPTIPSFEDEYATFVEKQERLQRELIADLRESDRYGDSLDAGAYQFVTGLHETGAPDAPSPRLWTNYKLLQAWDRLSLYCCLGDLSSEETIAPVPTGPDTDVELRLEPVDETTVEIDPYPFDTSPLTVPVRGRTFPNVEYEDQAALVEAYYAADQQRYSFAFESK